MQMEAHPLDTAVADFRDMYEATLPKVYGFLSLRVGGNRALAEDLTAETYAAAVLLYKARRSDEVTLSWLRTVARRRLIDHWRRNAVASKNVVNLMPDDPDPAEIDVSSTVAAALAALSEAQRQALVLQHIEGYSVAEIADLLGRTPTGVQSLLNRARIAFRAAYEEIDNA